MKVNLDPNNKIQLMASIVITQKNTDNYICLIYNNKVFKLKKEEKIQLVLKKLQTEGLFIYEIIKVLGDNYANNLLKSLQKREMLRNFFVSNYLNTPVEKQLLYWSEFADNPNLIQQNIENVKVTIIGAGGTGSIILQHLVAAGLKNIHIVDFDIVNMSNLNRQLCFGINSVGKEKTQETIKYLLFMRNDLNITTTTCCIDSFVKLNTICEKNIPDLIICCADKPPLDIRIWHTQICIEKNIPVIFGGVGLHDGNIGPFLTNKADALKYLTKLEQCKTIVNIEEVISPSICWTNSLMAILMAGDILKFLSQTEEPLSKDKCIKINFKTLDKVIEVL